jgi:hypothetical protein
MKIKLALIFLAFGVMALGIKAAPEPSRAVVPGNWHIDIMLHGQPHLLSLALPGEKVRRNYWYLIYTVTNNTGKEVKFYPQFELLTDTFKLHRSEKRVSRQVFDTIKRQYAGTVPFLESQDQVTGILLQGEDNARDSVVIFEDFDPNATCVSIFASGLTNEIVKVKHPTRLDPATAMPEDVLLRKSLALDYKVSGDRLKPAERAMLYRDRKWIMR